MNFSRMEMSKLTRLGRDSLVTFIFLLKKICKKLLIFFSKKIYSGSVCTKWGEFVKSCAEPELAKQPHLILLKVKLDYIPNILPLTKCSAKLAFRLQRGSKMRAKSSIFGIFFDFSKLNAKLIILEEKNCWRKLRSHRDWSFPSFVNSLGQFLADVSIKKG